MNGSDDEIPSAGASSLGTLSAYAEIGRAFPSLVSTLIVIADDPRASGPLAAGVAARMAADSLRDAAATSDAARAIIENIRSQFARKLAAAESRSKP